MNGNNGVLGFFIFNKASNKLELILNRNISDDNALVERLITISVDSG